MSPDLDLRKRHFVRPRGDITAIGTWIRLEGRWKPCLVLVRTGEETAETTTPCVITADRAWIWSEQVGDPAEAARSMHAFLPALRLDPLNRKNHFRVFSIIHDLIGDLLHIPPYRGDQVAVAEITLSDSTGRTRETELREHV